VLARLDADGKMSSSTVLTLEGAPSTQNMSGSWKLDGKRITIKINGEADTFCDVDGKRLRCQKATLYSLFGHYVLVRK